MGKHNLSANGYHTMSQVLPAVKLKVIKHLVPSHPAVEHSSVPLVSWVRHLFLHESYHVRGEVMALHTCQIQQYEFDHCEQQFEK